MDAAAKQLEQLNQEIAHVTAKAEVAQQAYLREADPPQEAKLKEVWQQLQDRLHPIDTMRAKLQDKLGAPGEHTPLLAHNCSV